MVGWVYPQYKEFRPWHISYFYLIIFWHDWICRVFYTAFEADLGKNSHKKKPSFAKSSWLVSGNLLTAQPFGGNRFRLVSFV